MNRLSVRLTDDEFRKLDSLGCASRTENARIAIKYAKKYKDKMDKKNGRKNTKHKTEEA